MVANVPSRALSSRTSPSVQSSISGFVLVAGAVAYALLVGVLGVTFTATPFCLGVIALAAGLVGPRRHLVPVGLVLAAWGVSVLLASEVSSLGNRATPLETVGVGAGLYLVRLVAPDDERGAWLTSGTLVVLFSGLFHLLAFNTDKIGKWQAWTVVLILWGLWELRPSPARVDAEPPSKP